MMASARDGDGSVLEAIQYLIRHLLENKYALNKYKKKAKKSESKKVTHLEYEGLQMCNVKQVRIRNNIWS